MRRRPGTFAYAAVACALVTAVSLFVLLRGEASAEVHRPEDSSVADRSYGTGDVVPASSSALSRMKAADTPRAVAVANAADEEEAEREREAARRVWEKRLDRSRHTLAQYVEATRYPPTSRPIREHPDQLEPAAPERDVPLDPEGRTRIVLAQDRVFLSGDESVRFSVRCHSAEGAPVPCEVTRSSARESEHHPGAMALAEMPLAFAPDGSGGLTAALTPSRDGFALYEGTLRVHLEVRSGELSRSALFDVMYTPSPPARFTGQVRETAEEGSLQLHVGLEVRKAGRYVVTGRVDDAEGRPFALVTFNEELGAGTREATLTVFGKLLIDERPAQPLVLRDVEGFLLRETGDPDRELLGSLRGRVHQTQQYALSRFSADEWQSEERERYVKELSSDVQRAESALSRLDDAR